MMSGPIVRRYGFPNFEKIFGERPVEHGIEEGETSEAQIEKPGPPDKKSEGPKSGQGDTTKKPIES
jgi:hypothetical protein